MVDYLDQLRISFERHAEKNAFCINDQFYSYKAFGDLVASISHRMLSVDKREGRNVGVVLLNDIQTYASLMACWFSGNAFVPLHHSFPKERNSFIAKESHITLILSSSGNTKEMVDLTDMAVIDTRECCPGREEKLRISKTNDDGNAYILFTSGSTGMPKGVPISRNNIAAFIHNFLSTPFVIESSDKCLQMFELTFDVSISSFLIPLLRGACVYTVPEGIKYVEVLKLIRDHRLTSLQIVPSIIRLGRGLIKRLQFDWVRNCILTGEATSVDLLPDWRKCLPNARIFNFYGPTESTIYCSFYEVGEEPKDYNGMLAIGKPMGTTRLVIVDANNTELNPNEKGELLISGEQVTTGYINNTEKNLTSFISLSDSTMKYYRSGDLCFRDEEGDIYYCGRLDNQVKINGFRVELGEIEHLLRGELQLNNVVLVSYQEEIPELISVLESNKSIDKTAIIEFLQKKLPDYMVPRRIETLNEFPLGTSGKTDRVKIKEMLTGRG